MPIPRDFRALDRNVMHFHAKGTANMQHLPTVERLHERDIAFTSQVQSRHNIKAVELANEAGWNFLHAQIPFPKPSPAPHPSATP